MFVQPAKSTLESWKICLGLAPLPEKIIKDTLNNSASQSKITDDLKRWGERVVMSSSEIARVKEEMIPMIENKETIKAIYNDLVKRDVLPKTCSGSIPSCDRIGKIVRDIRKGRDIKVATHRQRNIIDTQKLCHDMHGNGMSNDEIAQKLNVKPATVANMRSLYRRRQGLPNARIKDSQKRCYELSKSGMTVDEISEQLGLKPITVTTNISKRRKFLKERC